MWFAGRSEGQEYNVAQQRGFKFAAIKASRFPTGISAALLLFALRTVVAFAQASFWIWRIRPCLILGFGGYVSFPIVLAGIAGRVPVFLQEQNVVPGKVNRILSKWVKGMFTSFEETAGMVRCAVYQTGTPTRFESRGRNDSAVCREKLGLEPSRKTIFAFGGSQGAVSINRAMLEFAELEKENHELQVLHLTGERNFEEVKGQYEKILPSEIAGVKVQLLSSSNATHHAPCTTHGLMVLVKPYLEEMDLGYGAADIVVCRAGAATLAELMDFGVPAVLVPYPHATEAHQERNAEIMERAGAAAVLSNGLLSGEKILSLTRELFGNPGVLSSMAQKSKSFRAGNATDRIIEVTRQYIRG